MKKYIGTKGANGWPGNIWVLDGPGQKRLQHHPYHSPDGFSWGYGGSGPSELAKDLLWDVLGYRPQSILYHHFKDEFIATIPQEEEWAIEESVIRDWLAAQPEEQKLAVV